MLMIRVYKGTIMFSHDGGQTWSYVLGGPAFVVREAA